MRIILIGLLFITSCGNPFQGKTALLFRDMNREEREALKAREEEREREKLEFLAEKKLTAEKIVSDANESFQEIRPLLKQKCFDCHDANTQQRFYARIFPSKNPLAQHRVEGLEALDFANGYPLKAKGNPPQISLLKAIRDAVEERSMPIKLYRFVYPGRKITDDDEARILAWVNPLITRLEDYTSKYEAAVGPEAISHQILEQRCFRCHANGNDDGSFGDMEKKSVLLSGKYVNLKDPMASKLYRIVAKGKMPPSKREQLLADELESLKDWLILESKASN